LLKRKGLTQLVQYGYLKFGIRTTVGMLDEIKNLGFLYATRAGISIGIDDMVVPASKPALVKDAEKQVIEVQQQYQEGAITHGERYNKIIEIWSKVTEKVSEEMFKVMETDDRTGRYLNPIYIMADSGSRGSKQQIRQLSGMRGLMAKPSGEIIETPITANFREGLNVLQYFISTHGARKGLADTALKTADSGYLTRRLVDVAQDVIVTEDDCGTNEGIYVESITDSAGETIEPLRDRIVGRVALEDQHDYEGNVIVPMNQEITEDLAAAIQSSGIDRVKIRSVLTCESKRGVCQLCYGRNLATGRMVERGEAVGVIAAQSIGEPGTQLTMRTFHIGGAARVSEQSTQDAKSDGFVKFHAIVTVRNAKRELVVMNRNGILAVLDEKGREKERYPVIYGARIVCEDGGKVKANQILLEWDPYTFSILTEVSGVVHFKDMQDGLTIQEQVDEITGMSQWVVTDSIDEKKLPTIVVRPGATRADEKRYLMPTHAHLMVREGEEVHAGDVLAKIPRATTKTKDITGGLPRVVELFEARRPREAAVLTEVNGTVKYGEFAKGYRKVHVVADDGQQREYLVPRGVHVNVQESERVHAGDPLMDGPRDPHKILDILGEKELQRYLVNEIQEVYRLQGVHINDKHLEVIVRQMMRWVRVEDISDSEFLPEEVVDKFKFREENQRVIEAGGRPATGKAVLLGITKASLSTDSFISAASFQETTRVLTEAAINGRVDHLRGLKENVIMGRLIPAGTGMAYYRSVKIAGEDVVEEETMAETESVLSDVMAEYGVETPVQYSGGLPAEIDLGDTSAE
jgi:DNA-directed RNA polymerase subunit beta'